MKKGFTLVEIIVALAIISTLTLVVMQIYLTMTKLEIESQEEDYARTTIQNMHRLFVADPAGWEDAFYVSYGHLEVTPPEVFVFRFDSQWNLLLPSETGVYTISYDYGLVDEDPPVAIDVYYLKVSLVLSEKRTIFGSIDLGRMVVQT